MMNVLFTLFILDLYISVNLRTKYLNFFYYFLKYFERPAITIRDRYIPNQQQTQ